MPNHASRSFCLVLAFALPWIAAADDGRLDPGFGDAGMALVGTPGVAEFSIVTGFHTVAWHPGAGQAIVAASGIMPGGNTDFVIVRLAGSALDTSFGLGGIATVAFDRGGTNSDRVTALAVQDDGRILVAGPVAGTVAQGDDFGIARLTAAGQLDTSFGNGGKTTVEFDLVPGGRNDQVAGLALQEDGRILLAGVATRDNGGMLMAVARLTPEGVRDTSFDVDGRVTLEFGGTMAMAYAIKPLASGKLLVAGTANTSGKDDLDFALARLDAAGQPDPGFGTGGLATYAFDIGGDRWDLVMDFVENADHTLLACGGAETSGSGNFDFACMRFLEDGTPDPAFTPLLLAFDAGGDRNDAVQQIQRDAQGRYLLGGMARVGPANMDFALARLLPDGTPDQTFGSHGRATVGSPLVDGRDTDNPLVGFTRQPDGGILLAGLAATVSPAEGDYSKYKLEVARVIGDTVFADDFDP